MIKVPKVLNLSICNTGYWKPGKARLSSHTRPTEFHKKHYIKRDAKLVSFPAEKISLSRSGAIIPRASSRWQGRQRVTSLVHS